MAEPPLFQALTYSSVLKVSKLKIGYDRIPQRVLSEGINHLLSSLTGLFKLITTQNSIPDQWLTSKIIPIHKKGPKQNIENYRPISNLCSTSTIFEKLILKRIQNIEALNNIDLTGPNQHGFKKKVLQRLVSRYNLL